MCKEQGGLAGSRAGLLAVGLIILSIASPAWGALGGDTASIEADRVHMQGTRKMRAAEFFAVHEIQAANGTVVREFVSNEGKVFAVAWHGPWQPDMRQLLGSYFDQYARAAQSRGGARMGRRPVMIDEAGLVVEISGHLRAFAGRAYVPEMLPAGVQVESIQ